MMLYRLRVGVITRTEMAEKTMKETDGAMEAESEREGKEHRTRITIVKTRACFLTRG